VRVNIKALSGFTIENSFLSQILYGHILKHPGVDVAMEMTSNFLGRILFVLLGKER
jgi:hypothetical protein